MERLGKDLRRTTDLSYVQLPGFTSDTTLTLTTMTAAGGSETVVYTFHHATDEVSRAVNGGAKEVVLQDIVALYYKFYDSSGVQTTLKDDIKMVETSMVFEEDIVNVQATQTMNSTKVVLRNRAVN